MDSTDRRSNEKRIERCGLVVVTSITQAHTFTIQDKRGVEQTERLVRGINI